MPLPSGSIISLSNSKKAKFKYVNIAMILTNVCRLAEIDLQFFSLISVLTSIFMKLALFDLDHTLLNTDSDHSWGEFLVSEGLVDPVQHRAMNDKFYDDYKKGQLDPYAYNEFVFQFLTQHDNDYLTELHQLFMQKVIRPQMRPEGFKAIERHREAGHALVGITATSDFITAPIFREFGITEIIATNAEAIDGKYTGKVINTACYQ